MEGAMQASAPRKGGENQPAHTQAQEEPTVHAFQQVAEGSPSTLFCNFITLSLLAQNNIHTHKNMNGSFSVLNVRKH